MLLSTLAKAIRGKHRRQSGQCAYVHQLVEKGSAIGAHGYSSFRGCYTSEEEQFIGNSVHHNCFCFVLRIQNKPFYPGPLLLPLVVTPGPFPLPPTGQPSFRSNMCNVK